MWPKRHDSRAMAFGGLRTDREHSVGYIQVPNLESTQLLSPKGRVVAESKHGAVSENLIQHDCEDGAPLVIGRDPRERFEAADEAANAVLALANRYAKSARGGVLAPSDRVLLPDAFEDKVVVEQPNGGQALRMVALAKPICLEPAAALGRWQRSLTHRATCSRPAVASSTPAALLNRR